MPIYPYDFINSHSHRHNPSSCFVLMPFARSFDDVYEAINMACKSLLLSCSRADDFFGAGHIMQDILQGIVASEYILADITGKNPNVFYELGIAHSSKTMSKVIIISQSLDDVPFDLRHMRCIIYRNDLSGLRKLRSDLERAFQTDLQGVYHFEVEEHRPYKFGERLSGVNRNFYTFTLDNLHVAHGAAKFAVILHRESLDEGNATLKPDYYYLEAGRSEVIRMTDWEIRLDRTEHRRAYFTVQRTRAL